jgi:chemotaxis-related protein WspD
MVERVFHTPTGGDCWNQIGVWAIGGGTCPRLEETGHCRNCEVFTHAGRGLLDRPIPPGLVDERTSQYAQEGKAGEAERFSITVFRIGSEWLALRTNSVQEVTEHRPVHRLPHRSNRKLLGVTTIRGELYLTLSLAELLGIGPGDGTESTGGRLVVPRHIVMRRGEHSYAFGVDEALGVYDVRVDQLQPVPGTLEKASVRFVESLAEVAGHSVGLLDEELLVYGFSQALT